MVILFKLALLLQLKDIGHFQLTHIIFTLFLALAVSFIGYKLRFLTTGGAAATGFLAIVIFGLGSWKWTIPVFTFFFLSSLLSKLRQEKNSHVDTFFEKSGQRDYMQVISNGGIAGLLIIINYFIQSELIYYAFVSSLAAVCADTWATETGTLRQTKTYSILNFKEVTQGVSGGVSLAGFTGTLAGALIVALSSLFWIEANALIFIFLILLSGFSASIIDSILGAALQVQYRCVQCSSRTERSVHCGVAAGKEKGFRWINNDVVNLFSGAAGALIGLFLTDLILN